MEENGGEGSDWPRGHGLRSPGHWSWRAGAWASWPSTDFGLIWRNGHPLASSATLTLANQFGESPASVKEAWNLVIIEGMHTSSDETERVWPSSKDVIFLWLL